MHHLTGAAGDSKRHALAHVAARRAGRWHNSVARSTGRAAPLVCSSGGSTYMRAPPLESSTAAPPRCAAPRLRRLTSPRSTKPVGAPLSRRRRVLRSMTRARLFPGIRILTKKLKENISYVILYYAMGTFKNYVLDEKLRHICAFSFA